MGNLNASQIINGDLQVPGFRMNPKIIVDFDTLTKDPRNKLWAEF